MTSCTDGRCEMPNEDKNAKDEEGGDTGVGAAAKENDPLLRRSSNGGGGGGGGRQRGSLVEVVHNAFVDELKAFGKNNDGGSTTVGDHVSGSMTSQSSSYSQQPDPKYLLQMNLTRNFSLLPGDVADAATSVAASDEEEQRRQQAAAATVAESPAPASSSSSTSASASSSGIPLVAYLLLAIAVVSLSSIGPLLIVQQDATPSMKLYWRMIATSLFLLPITLYTDWNGSPSSKNVHSSSSSTVSTGTDMTRQQQGQGWWPRGLTAQDWFIFLLAAACYVMLCLGFVVALDYTSVGNVVILSNSQAIMLLLGRVILKGHRTVAWLEAVGALVAFSGAVLCSMDSSDTGPADQKTWLGDLIGLLSGVGGTGYLVLAKHIRNKMPVCFFMCLVMFVGCLYVLAFQIWVLGETVTFGMDVETGIWGFLRMRMDRFPLELVIVVVCNVFGSMGYISAMKHFSNLVIAVASLMEPVIAEFMAAALAVGFLPGWKGWLGNILVAAGTFAVIFPSDGRMPGAGGKQRRDQDYDGRGGGGNGGNGGKMRGSHRNKSRKSRASKRKKIEEYELKKRHEGCTGMFWRSDPTGATPPTGSSENWPRDGARIRGTVYVDDKGDTTWLLATHVKQLGSDTWDKAPAGASLPMEYNDHYYLQKIEEYELMKSRPGCSGMFWRSDPTAPSDNTTGIISSDCWPRDHAKLRGTVITDKKGAKWLLCTELKQPFNETWEDAPPGAALPFEYDNHYYLA